MLLTLRKLQIVTTHRFRPKLKSVSEFVVQKFRVLPTDLDENLHMNNGRYVNYMEVGRWELMGRTGFLNLGIKEKWIAPIASLKVQYFRALKNFQEFTLKTKIVGWDEKWIFVEQRFESGGKLIALGLVTSVVKRGRDTVKPEEIFKMLNLEFETQPLSARLSAWQKLDQELQDNTRHERWGDVEAQ